MKSTTEVLGKMPKQKHVCSIHFYEDQIFCEKTNTDNTKACYEVSGEQVEQLFSGKSFSSGLLDRNTVYYAQVGSEEEIAIFIPTKVRDIKVKTGDKEQVYKVPLPNLIFYGFKKEYRVFAVKESELEEHTVVYQAPLPNVGHSGDICQGTVNFPKATRNTIYAAADLFFQSYFNNDLSNGKSKKHEKNVIGLLKKIDGKKKFPLSDLVSAGNTLRNLFKRRLE